MEDVLDALKREITRWVKTAQPLIEDAQVGSPTIKIRTTIRFQVGDEVMLMGPTEYESPKRFHIKEVLDQNTITLSHPVTHPWTVSDGAVLAKTIKKTLVQGIYIGQPDNIPKYPAITINGISTDYPEWLTLNSVKAIHNVEVGIFVEDSTQEAGYRTLMELARIVTVCLQRNIFPLLNDYETTSVTQDLYQGDRIIHVADSSLFCPGNIILIEDQYKVQENRVQSIIDSQTIQIANDIMPNPFPHEDGTPTYSASDSPIVILLKKFIFNSWPKEVVFGKIHQGTLLKAATINWFGLEEIISPLGGGGWSEPTLK